MQHAKKLNRDEKSKRAQFFDRIRASIDFFFFKILIDKFSDVWLKNIYFDFDFQFFRFK